MIDVTRLHEAAYLARERALPGATIETIEADKRRLYESRVRAEGGRFVPFVLDEFGKLGASATWLLHALALRAAERQRMDFRLGATLEARAARLRALWTASIAGVLHATITDGIHQRLMASLRASAGSGVGLGG